MGAGWVAIGTSRVGMGVSNGTPVGSGGASVGGGVVAVGAVCSSHASPSDVVSTITPKAAIKRRQGKTRA